MRRWGALLVLASGCVTTPPAPTPLPPTPAPVVVTPDLESEARGAIDQFVAATEAGQFAEALRLLSQPLRDRYTPELLGRDLSFDPLGRERVLRIKEKRGNPLAIAGEKAALEWAPGRHLRLTREGGSWKIAALE